MAFNYNLLSQIKQAAAKQADAEQMRDKPQSEHLPPSTEGSAPPGGFFWRGADGRIYDLTDFSENKEIEQQFDKLFTSLPNLVKGRMGPSSGSKKDQNEKQEKKEEKSEKEAALSLSKLAAGPFRLRRQQPAYQQRNKYMPVFEQPAAQQQFVAPEQSAPPAPEPVPTVDTTGLDALLPQNLQRGAENLNKQRYGFNMLSQLFGGPNVATPMAPDRSELGFEIPPGTPQGGGEPGAPTAPQITPSYIYDRFKTLPSELAQKARLVNSEMKRNYLKDLSDKSIVRQSKGNYYFQHTPEEELRIQQKLNDPRFSQFKDEFKERDRNIAAQSLRDANRIQRQKDMQTEVRQFDPTAPARGDDAVTYRQPTFADKPDPYAQFSDQALENFAAPLSLLDPKTRDSIGFQGRRALRDQRELDLTKEIAGLETSIANKKQMGEITGTGYSPLNNPEEERINQLQSQLSALKDRSTREMNDRYRMGYGDFLSPEIVNENLKNIKDQANKNYDYSNRKNRQGLSEAYDVYDSLYNPDQTQRVDRSYETVDPYVLRDRQRQLAVPGASPTAPALSARDKARALAEGTTAPEASRDPMALSNLMPQQVGAKPQSRASLAALGLGDSETAGQAGAGAQVSAPKTDIGGLTATSEPSTAANAAAAGMIAPNLAGTPLSALAPSLLGASKAQERSYSVPEQASASSSTEPSGAIPGITMNTQDVSAPSGEVPGITMNQGNVPGLDALAAKPTTAPASNSVAAVKERTGGNWDNVIQAAKERGNPSVQPGFAKAPKPEPSFLDEAKGLQPRIDALREKYDMMARAGITDDAFKVKREADDLAAQQAEMRRVHYEDAKAKRENTQQDALAAIRQRARDRGLAFSEPGAKPDGAQFINADVVGPNPNARLAGEGAAPAPRAVPAQRPRQPYQRPPENTVVGAPRPDSGGPSLITSQFSGGSSQPQRASGIGYGPDGRRTFTPPAQESKIEAPAASGAKPNNFNPATGKLVGSRTNTASPNK